MPYWVAADTSKQKRVLLGPYATEGAADQAREHLDDGHSATFRTSSWTRSEAVQEIRRQRIEGGDVDAAYQNYNHKGAADDAVSGT